MNEEEMDDIPSGLGVLGSSISSAIRRGGPLADVLQQKIEVDYEPMPMEERRAPARDTRYRDELMAQLEQAKQKLLAPKPEPKTLLDKLARQFAIPTGKSGNLLIARQERDAKEAQDEMKRRETLLNLVAKQAEMEREQELDLAAKRRAELEEQRRLAEASKPEKLQADAQKIIDLQLIIDDPNRSQDEKDAAKRQINAIGRQTSSADRSILGQLVRANQMLTSKNPEEVRAAQSFIARYSPSGKPPVTVPQARTDRMIKAAKAFLATVDLKERAAAFANPYPNERQQKIKDAVRLAEQPTYEEVATSGGFSAEPIPDEEEG